MGNSKKSISPVVATALLLVVAVTAVVGFQNWFSFFESSTLTGIEIVSTDNSISVQGIIGNILYLKSGSNQNLSLLKIQNSKGNTKCEFSGTKEVNSSGLVGFWKFDDIINNSGTLIVEDKSGNGNNAVELTNYKINTTGITNTTYIEINRSSYSLGNVINYILEYSGNKAKILTYYYNSSTKIYNLNLNQSIIGLTSGVEVKIYGNTPELSNGKISKSLYLNFSNPFIVPFNESFNSKNITVSYWFKIVKLSNVKFVDLVTRWNCTNVCIGWWSGINLYNINADDYKKIQLGSFGNQTIGFKGKSSFGQKNISELDIWVNEVFTFNFDDGRVLSYLNYNLDMNFTNSSEQFIYNFSEPIYFGSSSHILPTVYDGRYLDQVRFYNRILSDSEIKFLYFEGISNLNSGINSIDVSSCNLTTGNIYDIVGFTPNSKVEMKVIPK